MGTEGDLDLQAEAQALGDEDLGGDADRAVIVAPHPDDAAPIPERMLPPEPTVVRGRRVARRLERRRRLIFVGAVLGAIGVLAGVLVFVLPGGENREAPRQPAAYGPAPPSVAWALTWQNGALGSSLAVVAVPPGAPPFAVVVPDDTRVDLPNGAPLTAGPATSNGPAAIETAQALLNRRVGHYVFSTPADIAALVDRLGGITFGAQGSIIVEGAPIGPGETTATGPQVEAYLLNGVGVDRWVRWEDVLSGLLDSKSEPSAWSSAPGRADVPHGASALLRDAHGATVVDLPTTHVFGLLKVDPDGVAAMLDSSFKDSVTGLVRVIVQNGNGRPGMGQQVGELLAPYGYRVIGSQNGTSFNEPQTKILASGQEYMRWAEEARGVLRAGMVYLDPQPTGIADIVIIVGRDFGTG
jgi:hypothetical protein